MYLASWRDPVYKPVHEISEYLNIPRHFLVKILQKLNEGEITTSKKGPKGGVSLTAKPSNIYMIDIVRAIDGNKLFNECALGCEDCHDGDPCSFHDQWLPVRRRLYKELSNTSLSEVTRNAKTKFPYI